MPRFYSSFIAVFTMKISAILGFGAICFLGVSISSLVLFSYSDPSLLIPGVETVSADVIMPPEIIHPRQLAESAEKIIYVSLKDQTLVYLEGTKIIGEFKISSGLPGTPTPPGEYTVLKKKPIVNYGGPGYYLPNTKWNLMFKTGPLNYYIHGAYWHHNFGHPMSHGCVNVSYADMEGLYNWADEGTKIIIQQESLDNLPSTNAKIYPTPPGSITASHVTDNSLAISWNAASDPAGVAGYQIFQNNVLVTTTTSAKYEASGLTSKTLYQFAVYAYNQTGSISAQSRQISVMTLPQRQTSRVFIPRQSPIATPLPVSAPKPISSANIN